MAWEQRIEVACEFEDEVADKLRSRGWEVEPYGQALLSNKARSMMRKNSMAQYRWLPDLLASRGLITLMVDAKSRVTNTGNHSVEKSALSSLVAHEKTSIMPVVMVFSDFGTIRACDLWDMLDDPAIRTGPPPRQGIGSGTPYWLIPKTKIPRDFDLWFGCE